MLRLSILTIIVLTILFSFCNYDLPFNHIHAMGERSRFVFAQLKYRGGDWNPRPHSGRRLVLELVKQTSVEARLETAPITPDDRGIFEYPFVYMAGDKEFEPFNEAEIENLRRFLEFGGTMLVDNCLGKQQIGFDKGMRREIGRIFPNKRLETLPQDHTIYRSFFIIKHPEGRIAEYPYLEGITLDDRTTIIYSNNDLGGAWSRDNLGNWEYEVTPGGEAQRKNAFRLGINIIMYALTGDYKKDQVHLPFIMKRQS